ncbi:MAG: ATPase [Lachnospiraceae bacterium]|nr:ATPase [Lachnospiraceae bacterium]
MLHDRMIAERRRLCVQANSLQKQIAQLPEGKIICAHNGNRCKWYRSDGKNKTYIPKKEHTLAEQLAVKKYLTLQLEEAQQEMRAIDFYLRHHNSSELASEQLLTSKDYQEILSPYFSPQSERYAEWMKAPYDKNPKAPESLIHKTAFGLRVRSKSESLIATLLYTKKIPFRYECALHLGAVVMYPDFTILHPVTGEIFYYEHFGMMDNPDYAANAHSKLQIYTSHGIIPSISLLTSFETKEKPLDMDMVEAMINHYFL